MDMKEEEKKRMCVIECLVLLSGPTEDEGVRNECSRLKCELQTMKTQELTYKAQIEKVSWFLWLPALTWLS